MDEGGWEEEGGGARRSWVWKLVFCVFRCFAILAFFNSFGGHLMVAGQFIWLDACVLGCQLVIQFE